MEKVSLEKIAAGALQEQFARAFERVIDNLVDPNTSYKDTRKITITLKFAQNEQRDNVFCDVNVVEKLAPQVQTQTTFAIGKDLKSGKVYANEYGRNQISIDLIPVDKESGEVLENEGIQGVRIIDFRNAE